MEQVVQIEPTLFREYDIRGIVDQDLTPQTIQWIGQAFGTYLKNKKISDCVVGFDARSYSEKVSKDLIQGLLKTGVNVISIGTCLTPMLYFAQFNLNISAGVMVTASHNPNGWTGFKLSYTPGLTLGTEEIQELHQMILNQNFVFGKGIEKQKSITEPYIKELVQKIKLKQKPKIVVNTRNGTAALFAPELFKLAGCQVIEQFCSLDTLFPNGNPNPSLQDMLEETGKKVIHEKADLGFAFDGDGDRLGIVDSKGNPIYADKIACVLSQHILKKQPYASIVFDVKCSQALPDVIAQSKGIPVMWKTGHSHIKHKAKEIKAAFAAERSGHFFFFDRYYGYDDALYTGLRVLEVLESEKKSLHELIQQLPHYVTAPVYAVTCRDTVKYQVVEKMVKNLKQKFPKVNDINGARVEFPDGFMLVRASSNEPILVLVFEAKSEKRLEEFKTIMKTELSQYPEIGKEWHYN
ncbi:MAG: phosphomannomutase/phosphoglucomutase [Candidatus Diapherotrites archaeon]|nr:phosphomannomutase/phosphoglucomutase [Candidatus Diapherotrites archaeon]